MKKKIRKMVCVAFCIIFCMFSLGAAQAQSNLTMSAKPTYGQSGIGMNTIYLDEHSHSSKVVMNLGDYLLVDLHTNPSTGYDWHLEELNQNVVAFRGKSYYGFSGPYGSPCRVLWRFQAVSLGTTELVMRYYRIWEGSESAIDLYRLDITVNKRYIYLDENDDGSNVVLPQNYYIVVSLPTNPSTGYDWHLEELDQKIVAFRGKFYYGFSRPYGSPCRVIWLFETIDCGVTNLVLKYYRIWEGSGSAIDTYTLHIMVL